MMLLQLHNSRLAVFVFPPRKASSESSRLDKFPGFDRNIHVVMDVLTLLSVQFVFSFLKFESFEDEKLHIQTEPWLVAVEVSMDWQ